MNEFKAKDIQELLEITKIRYEYIQKKADIQPGIEKVEGTGRSHLYTFGNLVDFVVAHRGSCYGLPPKSIAALVKHIHEVEGEAKTGLFNKDIEPKRFNIYFIDYGSELFLCTDIEGDIDLYPSIAQKQNFLSMDRKHPFYGRNLDSTLLSEILEDAKGYIRINLLSIKRDILKKL